MKKKLTLAAVLLMLWNASLQQQRRSNSFQELIPQRELRKSNSDAVFHRQIGLKGLLYRFGQNGITSPFPLDLFPAAHGVRPDRSSTELTCTAGSFAYV